MTWVNTLPKFEVEGEDGGGGGEEEEAAESDEPDAPEEGEEEEEEPDSDVPEEGAEEPAEDEDAKKPPVVKFLKEKDFNLRVPHERFISHKNLETLALSAPKT